MQKETLSSEYVVVFHFNVDSKTFFYVILSFLSI